MLEAVLFDWGETLVHWEWDPALLEAGHAAGLGALGKQPLPDFTERFVAAYLPALDTESLESPDYAGAMARLLAEFGITADDDELERFLTAEHAVWFSTHQLASTTHALLDTLRERGLKLGIVSNAFDPPALLHRDFVELGITERVDVAVFSSEAGLRKPHPAIFEQALQGLGVGADRTLFVGDSLIGDIGGAASLGMHTCQAVWFRADDDPDGAEPDFQAFTQMDVLTAVRRLGG